MTEGLSEIIAEVAAAFRSLKRVPGVKMAQRLISRTTGSSKRFSRRATYIIGCLGVKLRRTKLPPCFWLSRKRESSLDPLFPTRPEFSSATQERRPWVAIEGMEERSAKW